MIDSKPGHLADPALPAPHDPHWTERSLTPGGSRDALGIETLSETILADLLPGINNQTRNARYYSFWAWALRDLIRDSDATHTQQGFYVWLRRRESTLILAYLWHDCRAGVAGTEQGNKFWLGGEPASYPLDWKSLISVNGGAYELYYRGALEEMNITARSEGSLHDNLTDSIGLALADAYGASVAPSQYVQDHLSADRLGIKMIQDFAGFGCLCQLSGHDGERQALIDAFFRFDSPDRFAVRRLFSLGLFLDIIDQSGGASLTEAEFRVTLYFWGFGNSHAYKPRANALVPAQRWRVFQLRQYFVLAIESLWALFLGRIQAEALRGPEYMGWLLRELDLQKLAGDFNITLPDSDPQSLSVQAFFEAVRDASPTGALEPGHAGWQSRLNEHDLSLPMRQSNTASDVPVRAGHALLMLTLMYWRSQTWVDQPGWDYASLRFAAGRLPLQGYLRHVERSFEEGWSLSQWLGWLHMNYIWLQHRRVSLAKMMSRLNWKEKQETDKFEIVDDLADEASSLLESPGEPLFRGLGTDEPKMNGPRFPSALRILSDLSLIESTAKGGYRLLPDGQALLARIETYSIPEWSEPEENETATGVDETTG